MPTEAMRLVDRLCDEFEADWKAGRPPQIESFLRKAPAAPRAELFRSLLELEIEYRRDHGDEPAPQEYLARFPEHATAIRFGFEAHRKSAPRTAPPLPPGSTRRSLRRQSRAAADRNLLFGILAVQMDFIARDALISAMGAWLLDKSKSLGEVLLAQEAITRELLVLIDTLVQKHIELHGDDPEQSLASLNGAADLQRDLSQLDDADVATSMEHLSESHASGGRGYAATLPTGPASTIGPRFRVVRPHAKGGIGEILIAQDLELSRTVALKQIQPRHADNTEARARFLLEAEITGSLEHPGIVPVYGLGRHPDGRPFYAMRLIRGKSMKEAIDHYYAGRDAEESGADDGEPAEKQPALGAAGERTLQFRKLLGRFIDVCHAVQYAHSRGVLHRDLKPGNIMLGKYGEALVVDWGLAKSGKRGEQSHDAGESTLQPAHDSGSTPTRVGSVVGTPAYMPPEQATGRIHELSPASDVYSLGATLYHLLAGRPPFLDTEESSALRKAQAGAFPRLRELSPSISRSLEAICLQAMARRPDERYPSPMALADDLEQWLADEPVSAWPESRVERLRRWMRRHSSLVTGATSALIVGVALLTGAALLLNDARQREQVAKDQARTNFETAETNFHRAQAAVDQFYTQVSEETLLNQTGMQPLRRKLLGQALGYYEEFVAQRGGDAKLSGELAAAHFRMGEIREELESPLTALPELEQAREMQAKLAAQDGKDLPRLYAFSNTWNAIGRASQKLQRPDDALAAYEKALALRKKLIDREPGNVEYQRKYASSRMNVGLAQRALGQFGASQQNVEAAQQIRLRQLDRGEHLQLRRDLGMGYYNLAVFSLADGKGAVGQQHLYDAIAAFHNVLQQEPNDLSNQQRLAQCYRLLADRLLAIPDYVGAADAYERAREALETLMHRNPEAPEFQISLGAVQLNLSEIHRRQGETEAAVRAAEEAVDLLGPLAVADLAAPQCRREYAAALLALGELHASREETATALPLLEQAVARFQTLTSEFPADTDLAAKQGEAEAALEKVRTSKKP